MEGPSCPGAKPSSICKQRSNPASSSRQQGDPASSSRQQGDPASSSQKGNPASSSQKGEPASSRQQGEPASSRQQGEPASSRADDADDAAAGQGGEEEADPDTEALDRAEAMVTAAAAASSSKGARKAKAIRKTTDLRKKGQELFKRANLCINADYQKRHRINKDDYDGKNHWTNLLQSIASDGPILCRSWATLVFVSRGRGGVLWLRNPKAE